MKGWKRYFMLMVTRKKAGVAIRMSDKIEFKFKTVSSDKEGQCIMIRGSIL